VVNSLLKELEEYIPEASREKKIQRYLQQFSFN